MSLLCSSHVSSACVSCCTPQHTHPNAAASQAHCSGRPVQASAVRLESWVQQRQPPGVTQALPSCSSSSRSSSRGQGLPCQHCRVMAPSMLLSLSRRCSSSCCQMWMPCGSGRSRASSGACLDPLPHSPFASAHQAQSVHERPKSCSTEVASCRQLLSQLVPTLEAEPDLTLTLLLTLNKPCCALPLQVAAAQEPCRTVDHQALCRPSHAAGALPGQQHGPRCGV
jgi:hypothetical protein